MKKNSLLLLFSMVVFSVAAQTFKLNFKGDWMFTDVQLHKSQGNVSVNTMIDTGCTYCVIDSTYIEDNCAGFIDLGKDLVTEGKGYPSIILDSLVVCGKTFNDVKCLVLNLKRKFPDKFDFVLGVNILKQCVWKFNLKDSVLQICSSDEEFDGQMCKWENDKYYKFLPEDCVAFIGKVGKKTTMFYFDTGSNYCMLNKDLYDGQKVKVEAKVSTVKGTVTNIIPLYKDVNFKIKGNVFTCDFLESLLGNKKYNTINISFLKGKSFVLDYPQRKLIVL